MNLKKFIKECIDKGLWKENIQDRKYKMIMGDDILVIEIGGKKDKESYMKDLMYIDVIREICKIEYGDDWSMHFHKICHLVTSADRISYLLAK